MKIEDKMSQRDCMKAICHFARRCHKDKFRSSIEIYSATDYNLCYSKITIDQIIRILQGDVSLVADWLLYSQNKRSTPAWFFVKESKEHWKVGYMTLKGRSIFETRYHNSVEACAHMVIMEMEDYRSEKPKNQM